MRKHAVLMMILALVLSLLAGCGTKDAGSDNGADAPKQEQKKKH